MQEPRYPGLEIEVDMRQQKREWMVQRVCWLLLYALLGAIALGIIGRGPLSSAVLLSEDAALELEYERFLRRDSPDVLQLTLLARSDQVELAIDARYMQKIALQNVSPHPLQVRGGADSMRFLFAAQPGEQLTVVLRFTPEHIGPLHGNVALDGGPSTAFTQFVHP